jgi:uncharacterized protein
VSSGRHEGRLRVPGTQARLVAKGEKTCSDEELEDVGVYCNVEQTVNLPWDHYVEVYHDSQSGRRIQMLAAIVELYSFHVQELAGILEASINLEDAAPNDTVRNELTRRFSLQGVCLGAAFVGAIRGSFPLLGRLLSTWNYQVDHPLPDKPKTDGSKASLRAWERQGFNAGRPGACNTWVAPATKVS